MSGTSILERNVNDQDIGYRDIDEPVKVEIGADSLVVTLKDGRVISTPITWYPRLAQATPQQLAEVELGAWGLHWEELDEDLSIRGMLLGKPVVMP
jgi:hypothetical protein